MGTPLPPNEPGIPCVTCFGAGKPFGAAVTPKYITLSLVGLKQGQNWDPTLESKLLSPPLLTQTIIPCSFAADDGDFQWFVLWRAIGNLIWVTHIATNTDAFINFGSAACLLKYPDDNAAAAGTFAYGATANITWNTEGL